jgi:DNA repair protein RadC
VELLALVLGTLRPAEALASSFSDLRRLASAGIGELSAVPGVGFAQACRIKAALALAGRLGERPVARGTPLRGPAHVFALLAPRLAPLDHEVFLALALDVKLRHLAELPLASGGAAGVQIAPRDAFTALVRERAEAAIFVHNHPSGEVAPSDDDLRLTETLREAGKLVGIRVVDHLIVAQGGFYSFAESVWTAPK